MITYDLLLMLGVLYTAVGSDFLLNWGAGLITGKRLRPNSSNPLERLYYRIHAQADPNMRATPPITGPPDRIPAWNHALAVANGTVVLALEVVLIIGFLKLFQGRALPDYARLAAFAWIMRGTWGEISYWHTLTRNEVEPLRGRRLTWYWLIGMPQAFFPFLVAERFYEGSVQYSFVPGRFFAFLAVPVALMVFTRLSYRGRIY